ncbi:hypothetical protein SAMN05216562_0027 [Microbulbifer marinus]|uniref:Uncharacterized protein n=1 Tax=Microbulbifer marinus TaxID=658218 RepID=A0A1H3VKE7_9GAMM|nr:hypothetical protein SAMN05216562_0027 [Microbulbifer marinus]
MRALSSFTGIPREAQKLGKLRISKAFFLKEA